MKIFIGTEPRQQVASEVLKYSIRRRATMEFEIIDMMGLDLGVTQKMFTGFSIYRFHAPALAGYKGRALAMDADIIALADLKLLADLDMDTPAKARRRDVKSFATSVLLMDCERLKHWDVVSWAPNLNASKTVYHATLWGMAGGFTAHDLSPLESAWNHLDKLEENTKMLHYTSLPRQPWFARGHPHADVFLKELKHAIQNGVIKKDFVLAEEKCGHVYTGLLEDALKSK